MSAASRTIYFALWRTSEPTSAPREGTAASLSEAARTAGLAADLHDAADRYVGRVSAEGEVVLGPLGRPWAEGVCCG